MELWQTMGERAAQMMQSRAGRNGYTQGSKRKYFWGYPDNEVGNTSQAGYSDCSSAARSAILAAAGVDIGSNTNAQIKNRAKGQIVHETEGYYPDESQLLPGDCLYFKGNSGARAGRGPRGNVHRQRADLRARQRHGPENQGHARILPEPRRQPQAVFHGHPLGGGGRGGQTAAQAARWASGCSRRAARART